MDYRRIFIPGGTYFFTLVTFERRPIFSTSETIEILRNAIRFTMNILPFSIVAYVILPDHMHFIWTLPPDSSDYSTRWKMIKGRFSNNWLEKRTESALSSRRHKGELDVWQRRFWEHLIRDEDDLQHHVEYIHFNPVKHGLVHSVREWEYSSFKKYVRDGLYEMDWGGDGGILQDEKWLE
jgi:putative transposase